MSPSGDGWFGRPILRPAKEPPLPQIQHPAGHPREEVSKEFIVFKPGIGETSRTTFFPYAEDSHEGPKLAYSDLHELRKQGYIDLLGASHGDERCMVTNKALQIFRDTSEALSDSVFRTGDSESPCVRIVVACPDAARRGKL